MTDTVITMPRIILRSSLTTAAVIGIFFISVHLWEARRDKDKYGLQPKVLTQMADLQLPPTRSNIAPVAVTVSSNSFAESAQYAPEYLLEEGRTVWHAEHPPKYPQWVEISFSKPTVITHLGIRSQGDSPGGKEHCRSPKEFVFQATHDPNIRFEVLKKRKWDDFFSVNNHEYSQGEEWDDWFFENRTAYRYYRIYITAGGDPDYLTIRQIRLDNAEEPPQVVEKAPPAPVQAAPAAVAKIDKVSAVKPLMISPTLPQALLDPPLKIDPTRVRERYDKLQQRVGVKTKEEAMDFSLDFWEKKRKMYSL